MCVLPKAPKVPVMPERHAMQAPSDPTDTRTSLNVRRRRGMWASVFAGRPGGNLGAPMTTNSGAGKLG